MIRPGSPALRRGAAALSAAALLATASLAAPQATDGFYRAYYLEHELGDLEGALALYRAAAEDSALGAELQARAADLARSCAEELAARDLARLVPEDTILYLELQRPGEQLARLLDQLGLLQGPEGAGSFGVSPHLVEATLGLRAAAVAVTRVDPTGGMPGGIAILHPGDLQAVRGLIETVLPAGGAPADPIGGHPTFLVEGMVHVTITDRLVLASTERALIEGTLGRIADGGRDCLADHPDLGATMAMRGDDLLFFCLNAEPIIPLAQTMLGVAAAHEPELAMGLRLLDIESLESLAGRVGVEDDGVSFDLALQLAEGHRNVAFDLLRMPHVREHTFHLVPEGAAAFFATTLNAGLEGSAGVTGEDGRPVVTFMDLGREVFGNLRDVALFTMPTLSEGPGGQPMPDAALALSVNDPARTRAIWELLLGVAKGATGGGSTLPSRVEVAGVAVDRYEIEGVPVYLYTEGDRVVLSPSLRAVEASVGATRGKHVGADPAFARLVRESSSEHTSVLGVAVGRCAAMARPMIPQRELREIGPLLDALGSAVLTATTRHTDTRMGWSARLSGMPDVGPLVERFVRERSGLGAPRARFGRGDVDSLQRAHRAQSRAAAAPGVRAED